MVALAILSLMLAIIFVPLNLGINLTSIGTARSGAQQSAQTTINRMATELRKAIYVYPNERMARVTNASPYTNNPPQSPSTGTLGHPYYQEVSSVTDVCSGTMKPVDNTARIDFILPKQGADEQLQIPVTSSGSIVSFYARRQDNSKEWTAEPTPYNGNDNPIVLYRAQMPYLTEANATFKIGTTPNVDTSSNRYATTASCTSTDPNLKTTERGSRWLTQNGAGEPLLNAPGSTDGSTVSPTVDTAPASDTRITPLGMSLFAPNLDRTVDRSFQPETVFQCQDIDRNGKIDRVIITLALGQYDSRGAQNSAQVVRFSQVVDLPNVR